MNIRRVIVIFLATLSGVCFGVALSTFLMTNGYLSKSYRAYIVESGSMEPALKTGSVVITKAFENYSVGEIVTFTPPSENGLVTHRIAAIENDGNSPVYLTKGDANEEEDAWRIPKDQVVGKSVVAIPFLGYLADFVRTPKGFVILVVIPVSIIIYEEFKSVIKEIKNMIFRKSKDTGGNIKAGAVIPLAGILLLFVSATASQSFDKEVSFPNVFGLSSASSSPSPTPTPTPTGSPAPQSGSIVINEVNWVGSNGDGLDEWVELKNMTGSPVDLSGWVIEKLGTGNGVNANVTILSGTILANGFFLISNSDNANSRITVDPDLVDSNVSLDNGGEQLILKDSEGATIDTANDTGSWYAGSNSTPKKTMERITPPGDGTESASWQEATTHTNMEGNTATDEFGTPKAENGI